MKSYRTICVAFMMLLLLTIPASAQVGQFACHDLLRYCQNAKTYLQTYKNENAEAALPAALCVSYFTGFVDGSAAFSAAWKTPPFCVPQIETPQQLGLIFMEWADKNINQLKGSAAICVLNMLHDNFPCVSKD